MAAVGAKGSGCGPAQTLRVRANLLGVLLNLLGGSTVQSTGCGNHSPTRTYDLLGIPGFETLFSWDIRDLTLILPIAIFPPVTPNLYPADHPSLYPQDTPPMNSRTRIQPGNTEQIPWKPHDQALKTESAKHRNRFLLLNTRTHQRPLIRKI